MEVTVFKLISRYWSLSVPAENIRKPLVFCFHGINKETSGMKCVKDNMKE